VDAIQAVPIKLDQTQGNQKRAFPTASLEGSRKGGTLLRAKTGNVLGRVCGSDGQASRVERKAEGKEGQDQEAVTTHLSKHGEYLWRKPRTVVVWKGKKFDKEHVEHHVTSDHYSRDGSRRRASDWGGGKRRPCGALNTSFESEKRGEIRGGEMATSCARNPRPSNGQSEPVSASAGES